MVALHEFSNDLAKLVGKVGPSVVRVEAGRRVPGSGTVWGAEGTIVTADHVIEREDDISIGLPDGKTAPATLVGRDPTTDVAVLRAQAAGLVAPSWGAPDQAQVGQLVLALARPGRTVRARLGIISASGETWRAPTGGELDRYLEADIEIGFGFSGGPLLDMNGEVLGMATTGLLRHAALTVPVSTLRRVVDALLTHGRIRRGYLGLGAHPVRLPATGAKPGQERGLIVVSIEPGSPAERAGIVLGDVVTGVEGRPVRFFGDLHDALTAERIGKPVTLQVIRAGQARTLTVTVGERMAKSA